MLYDGVPEKVRVDFALGQIPDRSLAILARTLSWRGEQLRAIGEVLRVTYGVGNAFAHVLSNPEIGRLSLQALGLFEELERQIFHDIPSLYPELPVVRGYIDVEQSKKDAALLIGDAEGLGPLECDEEPLVVDVRRLTDSVCQAIDITLEVVEKIQRRQAENW